MSHVRTQIRQAVVTELTTATTLFTNIVSSRVYSFANADMPVCNVLIDTEDVEPVTMCANMLQRTAALATEIYHKAADNLDTLLDDLCVQVEKTLSDTTLGGLVESMVLQQSVFSFSGEGDQPYGTAVLTWEVVYTTSIDDPETAR